MKARVEDCPALAGLPPSLRGVLAEIVSGENALVMRPLLDAAFGSSSVNTLVELALVQVWTTWVSAVTLSPYAAEVLDVELRETDGDGSGLGAEAHWEPRGTIPPIVRVQSRGFSRFAYADVVPDPRPGPLDELVAAEEPAYLLDAETAEPVLLWGRRVERTPTRPRRQAKGKAKGRKRARKPVAA